MWFLYSLAILALLFWLIPLLFFEGKSLTEFDGDGGEKFEPSPEHSSEFKAVLEILREGAKITEGKVGRARMFAVREMMEALTADQTFDAEFIPVEDAKIRGEWVLAPGVSTKTRLLYIHGGAFFAGSPNSHRPVTVELSRRLNCAVFSLDYRLYPEHRRIAGINDCRLGYQWMLRNGPRGESQADQWLVAGDSAGGSLALGLVQWLRDNEIDAPHAVIAFAPSTDVTLSSPSIKVNAKKDLLLRDLMMKLSKVPRPILLWFSLINHQNLPAHPQISPVFGDLSNLPPTLIQVSDTEAMFDDSRRYAKKAEAHGSDVTLQVWREQMHVFQIFHPHLSTAQRAFDQVEKFVEQHVKPAIVVESNPA